MTNQRIAPTITERFWSRVAKTDGCWEWTGARTSGASPARRYGVFYLPRRKKTRAHRYSWELVNGPIPDGFHVLHRCDNPPCVRPDHLWLGTQVDNNRDMWRKGRGASGSRNGAHLHPERVVRQYGEANHLTRFSATEVAALRASPLPTRQAARTFGMSRTQVQRIRSGKYRSVA